MNTPAHIAVNLLLLAPKKHPRWALPAVAGSLAPDGPILLFYGWARIWEKMTEKEIWTVAYDHPGWQVISDLSHSLPISAAACLCMAAAGFPGTAIFFAASGLHALGDLLLHHDDAHRHLFPFSEWRFQSPVSYWDPAHHGTFFSSLEIGAVLLSAWVLARRFPGRKGWIAALVGVYVVYWGYVAVVWMG